MKITHWDIIDGDLCLPHSDIELKKTENGKIYMTTGFIELTFSKKQVKEILLEALNWVESV